MRIEEVQSTTKKQRIATHTHIKGLGLEVSTNSTPFPSPLQQEYHFFSCSLGRIMFLKDLNCIDFELSD